METLREMLDPAFLLRNSVYMSLLVGLVCPLVGAYLVLRRLILLGVALPHCRIRRTLGHHMQLITHTRVAQTTTSIFPRDRDPHCHSQEGLKAMTLVTWDMAVHAGGDLIPRLAVTYSQCCC